MCNVGSSTWFQENCKKKVGNGNTTRFWEDCWAPLKVLYPRLLRLEAVQHCKVKERINLLESDAVYSWQWTKKLLDREIDIVRELETKLRLAPLVENEEDTWIWNGQNSMHYSTKEGYKKLATCDLINPMKEWSRLVWNKWAPSKVNGFVWKLIQNRIPSKDNLQKRGVFFNHVDVCCKSCDGVLEDMWHIFGECKVAKHVWKLVYDWLKCDQVQGTNIGELLENHSKLPLKAERMICQMFWHCTVWHLWRARNESIYRNNSLSPWQIVERIKISTWSWLKGKNQLRAYNHFSSWLLEPILCISN